MKLAICVASLLLVSCAAVQSGAPTVASAPPAVRENHISLYAGQRNLDEDDWSPVDEQLTIGVEFSQEQPENMIGWEVGFMGSNDKDHISGTEVEVSTGEVYGGIRKTFGTGVVRPYVGGGLAFIHLDADVTGIGDDDDSSAAGYVHGGVAFALSESFFLGLDLRVLFGSDLEIAGFDTDADYGQLALVLGVAL
jgi:hypothetical protein